MPMIVSDPESYFRGLLPPRTDLLQRLEQEAQAEKIPIVGPMVGELLHVLVRAGQAENILELGTAIGYSAIYLASAAAVHGGRVISVDSDAAMAERARTNLREAGLLDTVEVRVGDAVRLTAALAGPLDFIFLDIDKPDYARVLEDCRRLLRPGGLLVADNTAFQEADDFNQKIAATPGWRRVMLFGFLPAHSPEWDGLCLALRESPKAGIQPAVL